jgi:FAD/FMN-containing dehydrogenase
MSGMDRILDWDPTTGLVTVEPGVSLRTLWHHILGDRWWPSVVSGTQRTSVGGLVAANAHGKNNHKHGPIGDYVRAFTLVTPDGQVREVTREGEPNLFHAAIGGFGWLGVFTSITLQTKKVYSGRMAVRLYGCANLAEQFEVFEECNGRGDDYVVGWIDAFGRGKGLGRGQVHAATYPAKGDDPEGESMFSVEQQEPGDKVFGVIPSRLMWRLGKPFAFPLGMRSINLGRYLWGSRANPEQVHHETHAAFNFLLDFIPDWEQIHRPGGLIQIQLFLPKERAEAVMREALELQQAEGLESWLIVMKRHRPDNYWLSHAVDGYSFAMDFHVSDANREALYRMGRRMQDMVVDAGGRFYLAKDSLVSGEALRASLGDEVLSRYLGLKAQLDPDGLIAGNQWRRVMGPVAKALEPHSFAEGEVFSVGPGTFGTR